MMTLAAALLFADPGANVFPERVPGLMEACLTDAVADADVTDTDDSHKYICSGDSAAQLWAFLERANLRSFEQETPEGRWLGREFPLGGCFKRVRMPDGTPASAGLSCTIWVPRPVAGAAAVRP